MRLLLERRLLEPRSMTHPPLLVSQDSLLRAPSTTSSSRTESAQDLPQQLLCLCPVVWCLTLHPQSHWGLAVTATLPSTAAMEITLARLVPVHHVSPSMSARPNLRS